MNLDKEIEVHEVEPLKEPVPEPIETPTELPVETPEPVTVPDREDRW